MDISKTPHLEQRQNKLPLSKKKGVLNIKLNIDGTLSHIFKNSKI